MTFSVEHAGIHQNKKYFISQELLQDSNSFFSSLVLATCSSSYVNVSQHLSQIFSPAVFHRHLINAVRLVNLMVVVVTFCLAKYKVLCERIR